MVIIPRHLRVLQELAAQKKKDLLGGMGWGALKDEAEPFSDDMLFGPLLERGLIEDLTATELGKGGNFFVRITPLGMLCMGLGLMLQESRKPTDAELKALRLPAPPPPPEEFIPTGATS
jgi:hypothetical protein